MCAKLIQDLCGMEGNQAKAVMQNISTEERDCLANHIGELTQEVAKALYEVSLDRD